MRYLFLIICCLLTLNSVAAPLSLSGAVQLYSQDQLLSLIQKNQHLQRVKDDDCQLNLDIMAHAIKLKEPAYQFLYGDMLLYGVCVERDAVAGMRFIHEAAGQGLPEALEQLGRYYLQGRFVQRSPERAEPYLRNAAALGNLNAQLQLAELYLDHVQGTPAHMELAYHWLFNSIIADKQQKQRAEQLLAKLAKRMPNHVIAHARRPLER